MDAGHVTTSRVYAVGDVAGLSQLADHYNAVVCDLWGTLHDGEALFAPAVAALQRYRAGGGVVVLLSNSPRTCTHIRSHLASMGLPRDCWDAIVTSGDVTVDLLSDQLHTPLLHIGPDRDLALYDAVEARTGVRPTLCDAERAELVVCTGTGGREPATFEDSLQRLAARGMPMLCANPDLTARKGAKLTFCAGTLARRYGELGGSVRYAGKPYPAIYAKAMDAIGRLRTATTRMLAIGDGMETDILGAQLQGWDAMHVVYAPQLACGEHASEDGHRPLVSPNDAPEGLVW